MIHRAFRYRLYPTPEQEETLRQFAGVTGIYCIRLRRRNYVGSAVNLRARLKLHASHLKCRRHHSAALQAAVDKYGAEAASCFILEIVGDRSLLVDREQHWIDRLNGFVGNGGYNILPNARSPIGRKHSPETRAKISAAHKGRAHSDEHRKNSSIARKGRPANPDAIRRGAETRRGMKRSPEAIAKAAAANRGQKRSAEARARMSEWQKGKPASPKLRAALEKISAANRGRRHSDETKAKMRAAKLGRTISEETRARMAEGQKRRQARERGCAPVEAGTCLEAA